MRDLWPRGLMQVRAGVSAPPPEVARPGCAEEVSAALRSARRVVPRGGGSGVCGAVQPEAGDLVLDLGGLDRFEIDAENLVVRAQAGVNGLRLERELNRRGLTLGHLPASLPVASVGGLVSTRSSGQESSRYGNVEDLLLGLTVALPDGTVVEARPPVRSAVGPALHHLFCGAEGGLGVVLEVELRVHPLPEATIGRGWRLPDVGGGLAAMRAVARRGLRPLVMRLYDPEDSLLQGEGEGCLLVAASAGPATVAEAEAELLAEMVPGQPLGEEPWRRWQRHRFEPSAQRLVEMLEPAGAYVDTIEVAARWTALPDLYGAVKAHLGAVAQLALCHFSHATPQACCAYFTFAGSAEDEEAAQAAHREAWRGAMELTLGHRGTISHHHGVGRARAPWVRAELGGWWRVWELVRDALDPERRMNPNAVGGRQ